ncbi:single-stranded DNA-binding protein [Mucilaginibacter pedocola]|uniref:Single-stranded DNA-binding protein n=1 Tax=Mucilaginibacter pedocola TaxID=1792845 RepID=A0A1S9PKQ6_9SPHI|nr:single-stranded DNA-binding protein [Mucilaginibacter pedocola]OOQ61509.1 hypothetical protein BC343_00045 [Mucilaginibacter pedocola]
MTINKVILIGRMAGRPQITKRPDHEFEITFFLITDEVFKKGGVPTEHHEKHRVVMQGNVAVTAYKKLNEGSDVYIEGQMKTLAYKDAISVKRYDTYIIGRSFELLYDRYAAGKSSFSVINHQNDSYNAG